MFHLVGMDFSRGADFPNTNKVNGMQAMIMQSQENLERVLPDFEAAIAAGYNPNDVKDQIFDQYNLTDDDFTDFDAKLLVQKVEAMYRAAKN
jgi:hypothetical protein